MKCKRCHIVQYHFVQWDLNYDRICSSLENGVVIYVVPIDANTAIGDSALGLFPIYTEGKFGKVWFYHPVIGHYTTLDYYHIGHELSLMGYQQRVWRTILFLCATLNATKHMCWQGLGTEST